MTEETSRSQMSNAELCQIKGEQTRRSAMRVVSLRRLREFWGIHPLAELRLRAWFTQTLAAQWWNFADLRSTFPSADMVGNCTVFNIGGNNFRLIAGAFYTSHKVYVFRVMTHADYDREDWPAQCGCYQPQPERSRPVRRQPRLKEQTVKRRANL